ncbi:tRNA wybutosine-synthesizing protein 2 homolog [Tubulanus polymorphus]|uniref:tRNA wybutosine-synthesizing protein 2 homolog n=1 Tax=Tubulanus polymorphus TaxID=672921 RepID=UPI003DA31A1E
METGPAVITTKQLAQSIRISLTENGLFDEKRTIGKFNDCVDTVAVPCIPPMRTDGDTSLLKQTGISIEGKHYEIVNVELPVSKQSRNKNTLKQLETALLELISSVTTIMSNGKNIEKSNEIDVEKLKRDVPRNWEVRGNLALIDEKYLQESIWKEFGDELWKTICKVLNVTKIALKSVVSTDGFRTPQVKLVYGEDSWVQHTDNRIKYCYDVTKCMFSSGNITEKLRVSSFPCSGETVVDLYAGIGYFTLPYLVHAGASFVHACEWNPDAVAALKRNLTLNKVANRCQIHEGDNRTIDLIDIADRVNLGLIPSSEDGWPVACRLLKRKSGGILHVHQNVASKPSNHDSELDTEQKISKSDDKKSEVSRIWTQWALRTASVIKHMLESLHKTEWNTNVLHIEHVKSYAPHVDHLVLDLECRPT